INSGAECVPAGADVHRHPAGDGDLRLTEAADRARIDARISGQRARQMAARAPAGLDALCLRGGACAQRATRGTEHLTHEIEAEHGGGGPARDVRRALGEEDPGAGQTVRAAEGAAWRHVSGHRLRRGELILDRRSDVVLAEKLERGEAEATDACAVERGAINRAEVAVETHGPDPAGEVVRTARRVARPVEVQRPQRADGALAELFGRVVAELRRVQLVLKTVAHERRVEMQVGRELAV